MSKIRILHVTFDMAIGGTEQVIRQLVLNLPASEFENEIFCIDGKIGAVGDMLQQQGIQIHTSPRQAGLDFQLIKTLRKILRSGRFDVVHCHQYTPWVYGWFAAWGTKAKVVFTEHGRFYPDRYRVKAWPLNAIMGHTTAAMMAISEATKNALKQYEWLPYSKIKVIYNGIQPLQANVEQTERLRSELGIPSGSHVLGTVARLDPVKNQKMMLQAFAKVLEQKSNCILLIVGDGPSRSELETLTETLGIQTQVRFTGFKTNVADYLALVDIYLLSSRTEGTSMTLLEAMHVSKPCVATSVGGNPEIVVHGLTGLLSPDDDACEFSNSILQILTDKNLQISFAEAGCKRFVELFTVHQMVLAYSNIYQRVCQK